MHTDEDYSEYAGSGAEVSPLRCPNCDYDLTGLPEDRCPECGEPFDRAALSRGVPQPATPWEVHPGVGTFLQTWRLAVFSPSRLARRFPARSLRGWSGFYCGLCYGCAVLLFWATFWVAGSYTVNGVDEKEFKALVLPATCSAVPSFWICEGLIAAVFAALLKPKRAPRGYAFWRGMVHYGSSFALPSGVAGGLLVVAMIAVGGSNRDLAIAVAGTLASLSFLAWCAALMLMAVRRSTFTSHSGLACLLVPMIGLLAIGIGFVGGVALVLALNPPTFC